MGRGLTKQGAGVFLRGRLTPQCTLWRVNIKSWCNPIWTRKSSLKAPLILTHLWAFLYIDCTKLTNYSFAATILKAYHTTCVGTRSQTFSKYANAKQTLFFANYFFCSCLKIRMLFVLSHRGMKPNFISWMFTCSLNYLINLSAKFRIWSANFSLLWCSLIIVPLSLMEIYNSAKFPFFRNNSFYYNLIYKVFDQVTSCFSCWIPHFRY